MLVFGITQVGIYFIAVKNKIIGIGPHQVVKFPFGYRFAPVTKI